MQAGRGRGQGAGERPAGRSERWSSRTLWAAPFRGLGYCTDEPCPNTAVYCCTVTTVSMGRLKVLQGSVTRVCCCCCCGGGGGGGGGGGVWDHSACLRSRLGLCSLQSCFACAGRRRAGAGDHVYVVPVSARPVTVIFIMGLCAHWTTGPGHAETMLDLV